MHPKVTPASSQGSKAFVVRYAIQPATAEIESAYVHACCDGDILNPGVTVPLQALHSGQFELSGTEVQRLLAPLSVAPSGEITYDDWIAALVDWRTVQVPHAMNPDSHAQALHPTVPSYQKRWQWETACTMVG